MKKTVLGGLLALSLALASCGGPAPTPSARTPTPQPAPAPMPADAPADSVAAREYLFTKKQSQRLAQSLGLRPQDAIDIGERLRVVLTINRAKSGENAGRKRAQAVLIWGRESVKLSGPVLVTLGKPASDLTLRTAEGKVNLAVTYPDYQAKTSKSTGYVNDDGAMCARFAFDLSADDGSGFASTSPLEVCEGDRDKDAELLALATYSAGLYYTHQSEGAARWETVRLPGNTLGPADVLTALGLPAGTPVKEESVSEFFAPLKVDAKGESTGYGNLERQFNYYYSDPKVYRVQVGAREEIYVLGRNGWGTSGLKTRRFGAAGSIPTEIPSIENAHVAVTFGGYGGMLVQELKVLGAPAGATMYATHNTRASDYCEPNPNLSQGYFALARNVEVLEIDGKTVYKMSRSPTVDDGKNLVMDYTIFIASGEQDREIKGSVCYTPNPPNLDRVEIYPDFSGSGGEAEAWLYLGAVPRGVTASATYRFEDSAQCAAGTSTLRGSGSFNLDAEGDNRSGTRWIDLVGPGTLTGAGPSTAMFYKLNLTGSDGKTRTVESFECYAGT